MTAPTVAIVSRTWERRGHGGRSIETDYEIFLNDVRLRMFSTNGNMNEGYWGSRAKPAAEKYAGAVARTLGVSVTRAKRKEAA